MIRGPVLPQLREGLWPVVSKRLSMIEHGLTLVMEGLDCSGGQLGLVDGLARDAAGAPVLVLLAAEGDALLVARVLAAADFLARAGEAFAVAVPEANFCPGAAGRVVVVGADTSRQLLDRLTQVSIPCLQVCRLEPFRIAGSERFAVTWLSMQSHAPCASEAVAAASIAPAAPAFVVAACRAAEWQALADLCLRIDPAVRIDGDRHWRRITWNGRPLGEVWSEQEFLFGAAAGEARRELATPADFRSFADRLLRQYSICAGLIPSKSSAVEPATAHAREAAPRHAANGRSAAPIGAESLRTVLATTRLSPEEYSALGGSALSAGDEAETATVGEESVQTGAAGNLWPPPKPTE